MPETMPTYMVEYDEENHEEDEEEITAALLCPPSDTLMCCASTWNFLHARSQSEARYAE